MNFEQAKARKDALISRIREIDDMFAGITKADKKTEGYRTLVRERVQCVQDLIQAKNLVKSFNLHKYRTFHDELRSAIVNGADLVGVIRELCIIIKDRNIRDMTPAELDVWHRATDIVRACTIRSDDNPTPSTDAIFKVYDGSFESAR